MYVYLAGPMTGLSHEEADGWRSDPSLLGALEKHGWKPLSPTDAVAKPWLKEKYAENVMPSRVHHATEQQEIALDLWQIHCASAVLANLGEAETVSIGTVCEIAYAFAWDRPVIVIDEDGSLHDHMFIRQFAAVTVPTLLEGVGELIKIGTKLKGAAVCLNETSSVNPSRSKKN